MCLMVKDENARFGEWLAYHYHVMPLRHLIVLLDPDSRTNPDFIFDTWRQYGMKIEVWKQEDFNFTGDWTSFEAQNPRWSLYATDATKLKRFRQQHFYGTCARHLKSIGHNWAAFVDVDEFVTFNNNGPDERLVHPGSVLKHLKSASVVPCLTMRQVLFGSSESHYTEVSRNVPSFLNATNNFDTLRFRHRAAFNEGMKGNKNVKCIVQLQRVDNVPLVVPHIHFVLGRHLCKEKGKTKDRTLTGPLIVHHYTSTKEKYFSHSDPRTTYARSFTVRSQVETVRDDDVIRPWIGGFVSSVGEEDAKSLLAHVGYLDPPLPAP